MLFRSLVFHAKESPIRTRAEVLSLVSSRFNSPDVVHSPAVRIPPNPGLLQRPRCTNGWADGMGVGNHGLGTRLSKMWGKLRKYPHQFEAVLSVQGYHRHFACRDFTGGGSFRARCNFGIARRGLRWRELSEHNETKIYLKYFGVTRRG